MKRHPSSSIAAALVVSTSAAALLAGCPEETTYGWRADRWRRYYPTETAGRPTSPDRAGLRQAQSSRASSGTQDAWEVPEGVKARDWRYIVIHHSATDEGSAATFDEYHREVKGWKGLAYHFVIGNGTRTPDGSVEVGYRWKRQIAGAHAGVREYNQHGIGVCLVGDFETARPTKKQMASLKELLAFLTERFSVAPADVVRHRDVATTKCPGRNFPWPVRY